MGCVETDKASILSNAVHQLTQLNAAGGPDGGCGGGGFVPPDQELQRLREVPPVFEGTGSLLPSVSRILRASDASAAGLPAALQLGMATLDLNCCCLDCNNAFAAWLGYTKPQLLGRHISGARRPLISPLQKRDADVGLVCVLTGHCSADLVHAEDLAEFSQATESLLGMPQDLAALLSLRLLGQSGEVLASKLRLCLVLGSSPEAAAVPGLDGAALLAEPVCFSLVPMYSFE